MARVAVDVCVGRKGINRLREAAHEVVVEALPCESDRDWFTRALIARAEVVISTDRDISILCYDHRVDFFRARPGHSGWVTAERFIQRYARRTT